MSTQADGNTNNGQQSQGGGGNAGAGGEGVDYKARYEHANTTATRLGNQVNELTAKLKPFEGIDIAKLQADSQKLHQLLEKSAKPEDQEAFKKRLEDTYSTKISTLEKDLETANKNVRTYRVTNEAMKLHGKYFVEGSEDEIQSLVDANCDWDDKAKVIVIKGSDGQPRYSTSRAGNLMNVEEYFQEIAGKRKYLAKSSARSGTFDGDGHNRGGSGGSSFNGQIPTGLTKEQYKEQFAKNPELLQAVLNSSINFRS